jgi:hypothetical protein
MFAQALQLIPVIGMLMSTAPDRVANRPMRGGCRFSQPGKFRSRLGVLTDPVGERQWDGHHEQGKAMDEAFSEVAELDDFQVIAERVRVMDTIAALTDRYQKLNDEMTRRATLAWMLP